MGRGVGCQMVEVTGQTCKSHISKDAETAFGKIQCLFMIKKKKKTPSKLEIAKNFSTNYIYRKPPAKITCGERTGCSLRRAQSRSPAFTPGWRPRPEPRGNEETRASHGFGKKRNPSKCTDHACSTS